MNFLRTAFWVVTAVALALFTKANWAITPTDSGYVPIKLWGEIILETRLPVLILAAFLLGLLPTWLWGRARKWQLQRKLNSTERALASAVGNQQPAPAVIETDTAAPTLSDSAPADASKAPK